MDAMDPVDSVEALYNAYPTPPRISQGEYMPGPCQHEKSIRRMRGVVRHLHPAGSKSIFKLEAEGGHAAGSFHARYDANARHGGIILIYVVARSGALTR